MRSKIMLAMGMLLMLGIMCQPQAMAQNRNTRSRDRQTGKKPPPPPPDKLPDLVVTGIKYAGNKAVITVWNKGEALSAPCKLTFTLGHENWTVDIPGLQPKGFVHTATISRGSLFAGTGVAKVDSGDQIVESNNNNNEMTINQSAEMPDLAAVSILFKSEGNVSKIIGVIKNVSKTAYLSSWEFTDKRKAVLTRIAKYGSHQSMLTVKEATLPSINPGVIYELKADMPPPFKGADSYLWILVIQGDDANAGNDKVEKTSKKFDNNN